MKPLVFISILALVAVFSAGCTTVPAPSPGPGQGGTIAPGTVVTLPAATAVDILVMQKDPVDSTVDVVFGGGNGQVLVSSCDVVFTRSDGPAETRKLMPEKGATVTLQGTKGTDRVEVTVTMKDGKSYRIIDQQIPYRTRG